MIAVLVLIFASVALVAAGFVVVPAMRVGAGTGINRRAGYAALAGLATVAIGLGVYGFLGQPKLALNSLTGPSRTDYPSLIAMLARRMPNRPGDVEGWSLLGRGYLTLGNADQAQKALAQAVQAEKTERGEADPQLLSSYGEAMTEAAGQVTKDAEDVFKQVLTQDPRDLVARYYTGLALATRGDKAQALQLWEGVLADAPPNTPWRGALIDQVAALTASAGGAAPNPEAMVEQLANRLQSSPDDLNGWLMLIRAYAVLGNKDKAAQALTTARGVFANQPDAQAALARAASDNSLN
ncbi:MAG: tetratricopeptide repeat protein [Alphaproteobacteria bacterium]|nr:tetratricopeptide repeat protein [Alphaproteobacteria bacterium]